MNEKAAVLGMENTHVANPIGLDDPDQYSTPRDIAVLAIAAMKKDPIRDLVSRKNYMVETVSGRNISVENTNPLVGELSGVIGLKTGYTGQAGLCLVTYVDDNPDLIVIVLNAEDRGEASKNLINWVRDNYTCESY
jgi:D-alanyl-D-alanine carboxypeptidase (penicillin-binding protein 5/6)